MRRLANAATHPGRLAIAVSVIACLGSLSDLVASAEAAQTAEQRRAIEAYSDSLEAVSDSAALKREESALLAAARYNRSEPFFHLRLAYVALRLGDLGGPAHSTKRPRSSEPRPSSSRDGPMPGSGWGVPSLLWRAGVPERTARS
jgi:hypothetical protein